MLDWKEIHRVQEDSLQEVLNRHEALFRDELGRIYSQDLREVRRYPSVLQGSLSAVRHEGQGERRA